MTTLKAGNNLMPLLYDDIPGSWGKQSESWPEVNYTMGKWLLCTKALVVPYGSYVKVGDKIRIETKELAIKLEETYIGMFVECRRLLILEEFTEQEVIDRYKHQRIYSY